MLTIEPVRRLAEDHDFYRREQENGIDLRQLAEDRESSMTALTEGERKTLESAIAHYQPMIKTAGIEVITKDLRDMLSQHYEKEPACIITSTGDSLNLPLSHDDFQALNLSKADEEAAKKAYYKNDAHSAWRYLSKPNPWMHTEASYVYINEEGTSVGQPLKNTCP